MSIKYNRPERHDRYEQDGSPSERFITPLQVHVELGGVLQKHEVQLRIMRTEQKSLFSLQKSHARCIDTPDNNIVQMMINKEVRLREMCNYGFARTQCMHEYYTGRMAMSRISQEPSSEPSSEEPSLKVSSSQASSLKATSLKATSSNPPNEYTINASQYDFDVEVPQYSFAVEKPQYSWTLHDTTYPQYAWNSESLTITTIDRSHRTATHDLSIPLKLSMKEWCVFPEHRSGWSYAMRALSTLRCSDTSAGVRVVDFMEKTFSWDLASSAQYHDKPHPIHISFNDTTWMLQSNEMRTYKGRHTFALASTSDVGQSNLIVSYNSKTTQWEQIDLSLEDFQHLPNPTSAIVEPWVGFLHNPPMIPMWFNSSHNPSTILQRDISQASMKQCKGVFVMSQYLKDWLLTQEYFPKYIPISVVLHPSEINDDTPRWSWEKYMENPSKSVIQVGYWLRVLHAIALLKVPDNMCKKWLYGNKHAFECLNKEIAATGNREQIETQFVESVEIVDHIDNDVYDRELSCNIVFVQMYDSSCNNAVIECILRHTPILVNPLPAVVEYLGHEYPLYFESLEEATFKLSQPELIKQAHEYLRDNTHLSQRLSAQAFVQSIVQSDVYTALPNVADLSDMLDAQQ